MKKLLGPLLAAALLVIPLVAGSAWAGNTFKFDFADFTCGDLEKAVKKNEEKEGLSFMYYWLEGYVAAKTNNTEMTVGDKYEDHVKRKLEGYVLLCSNKKETLLLDMINAILKK